MAVSTLPPQGAIASPPTALPPLNIGRSERGASILALDLGTTTGWAMRLGDGVIVSGTMAFRPGRYEGGGMRYLRFRSWLDHLLGGSKGIATIHFEEVRRHAGTDAAHIYGGFLAHLTAWCDLKHLPYQGVPVGTIKRHATGKGNAGKDAVIAAMRARGFNPEDDNEADALAILSWAIDTDGGMR
ncbi:crossover junction endodeoxyribonuclease RuvC [Paramagnetospirillum caucaseum]